LLSYEFLLAHDPAIFPTALEALRQAVQVEPHCGLVWTRLSRLCLANYAFEAADTPTPIDEAIAHAHHGVRLDPESRVARCVLGSALLVKGELEAARNEVEQALRLSPHSLCYREIVGLQLALLGDGNRGVALIQSARARNPLSLPHASFGLWFDHVRRGEYEAAYQAALGYRDPLFFWRSVMRACCLGHLGRREEAAAEVAELLRRRANFEARGRVLIGHYVKLPEVMSRIVDGLAKAGLKLQPCPPLAALGNKVR
jgi:tetratricopeptide (TPR) repeat protein